MKDTVEQEQEILERATYGMALARGWVDGLEVDSDQGVDYLQPIVDKYTELQAQRTDRVYASEALGLAIGVVLYGHSIHGRVPLWPATSHGIVPAHVRGRNAAYTRQTLIDHRDAGTLELVRIIMTLRYDDPYPPVQTAAEIIALALAHLAIHRRHFGDLRLGDRVTFVGAEHEWAVNEFHTAHVEGETFNFVGLESKDDWHLAKSLPVADVTKIGAR